MSELMVPISEASYSILCELAQKTGQSLEAVLDHAIEGYRRKAFLDAVNAGYGALRADTQAWDEDLAERKLWDATLMDGLDPAEQWTEDGHAITPGQGE
jgi:hypothetical protein